MGYYHPHTKKTGALLLSFSCSTDILPTLGGGKPRPYLVVYRYFAPN
jgi:hypothetical protein